MSESNGTNGAQAVADPSSAEAAIQAVANVQASQRPFSIPAKLAQKLAKARKDVGAVAKNGRNNDQNYNYVQVEDVVKEAGRALAEAEVIVMPGEPVKIEEENLRSGNNASGKLLRVTFVVRVIDGETGEGYETEQVGMGTDYPGDKALAKARSAMKKYFLSDLLEIPLGDGTDPEVTSHGSGGAVSQNDDSPASDKQKGFFKQLIGEKNLPKPARAAIVEFVGGTEPKKGPTSHAIDQLMNTDPLQFARECGWDGTVDAAEEPDAEAPKATEPAVEQSPPLPEQEGEALIEFCREKQAKKSELVVMLRSLGVTLPADSDMTDEILEEAIRTVPIAQVARLKQMVVAAAESKQASANADSPTQEQPETPAEDEPVDPNSKLGKTLERVGGLGYKSELSNLTWLLFDKADAKELTDEQLDLLVKQLERASAIGIQRASVATLIRAARESNSDVETRAERFDGWIAQREENAAQTKAAEEAHAAAEQPQETQE